MHTHAAKAGALGRLAALIAFSSRPPLLVHTFHGHSLTGYFSGATAGAYRVIKRQLARRTDVLVAVSPEVRDDLVRLGVAGPERFVVVPVGFDLARFLDDSDRARRRAALRAQWGIASEAEVVTLVSASGVWRRPSGGPPAGCLPSNPAALLSSQQIQLVLRRLKSENDLVVVDTPAALAVGDPLPLMRNVNGVILVGRVNRSGRRALRRLRRMIADADGTLLGAVATGVTRASGYYDGYSRELRAWRIERLDRALTVAGRRQAASDESAVSPGPAPPE